MGTVRKEIKDGYDLIGVVMYENEQKEVTWFNFLVWPRKERFL
jgi:hypothetical protein